MDALKAAIAARAGMLGEKGAFSAPTGAEEMDGSKATRSDTSLKAGPQHEEVEEEEDMFAARDDPYDLFGASTRKKTLATPKLSTSEQVNAFMSMNLVIEVLVNIWYGIHWILCVGNFGFASKAITF